MSPTQQLKHWQQILETLPTSTIPETKTKTTESSHTQNKTQTEQLPTERNTEKRKRPDNYSDMTKAQRYTWRKRNEDRNN